MVEKDKRAPVPQIKGKEPAPERKPATMTIRGRATPEVQK